MWGLYVLGFALGAVALCARPVDWNISQVNQKGHHWAFIFILLPGTVALGLLGATNAPTIFQIGAFGICLIAAVVGGASLGYGYLAAILSTVALGVYGGTGELGSLIVLPLCALAAIGGAVLVYLLFEARGCAILLLALTASDALLWRLGVLEAFIPLGAIGEIHLHILGAVTIGGWTLGVGDFFAAALLGIWLQPYSWLVTAIAIGVQSISLGGIAYLSASEDVVMPATLACSIALAVGLIITDKKMRRTRRKMDIPAKAS